MQYFPDCSALVILNASVLLEVRRDGPLTRTQLQASTHPPLESLGGAEPMVVCGGCVK